VLFGANIERERWIRAAILRPTAKAPFWIWIYNMSHCSLPVAVALLTRHIYLTRIHCLAAFVAYVAQLPAEKERCASSVINALQNEPELQQSTVFARVTILRAEVYLATDRLDLARRDLETALEALQRSALLSDPTTSTLVHRQQLQARAYRVLTDVHLQSGNVASAIQALRLLAECNPALRTKVNQELEQLLQLLQQL
jgi:tetratricopeptide (TPR) repeat protein